MTYFHSFHSVIIPFLFFFSSAFSDVILSIISCLHAKSFQSCPTLCPLCNPMDYSPPGSSVHGVLQARIPEWAAMPSSRRSSQPRDQTHVSCCSCIAGRFFIASPLGKSYYNLFSPFPILPFILSFLPSLFPSCKDPFLKGWISICYSSGFVNNYPRSPGFSSLLSWCVKKILKRIL